MPTDNNGNVRTIAWIATYRALAARDATAAKYLASDETEARFFLKGMIESDYRAGAEVDCHV